MKLLIIPKGNGSFRIDSIDLTDISALELIIGGDKAPKFGYTFAVHLDGPTGRKLGEAVMPGGAKSASAKGFGTMVKVADRSGDRPPVPPSLYRQPCYEPAGRRQSCLAGRAV
jgi:hypothetical protein